MARGTRKGGKGFGFLQRIWSPFDHLLMATGESAQRVGSTAGRIVKETVGLPANVGRTFARHGNMAVRNVFKGRKAGRTVRRR